MKQVPYIILVLILLACSSKEKTYHKEADTLYNTELEASEMKLTEKDVFSEKWNSYFELLQLKATHPQFEKDLTIQLKNRSQHSIIQIENIKNLSIENIEVTDDIVSISDTIEKIKLRFEIVDQEKRVMDSIYAYKTSAAVQVDYLTVPTFKIKFSKK